ncbi:MAG: T9SS type A sorting domain-containing protein [Flavobacteriales bacterium]|nr:T9SS type A sorting domain-containing protein [Flavobacteriales bacterium]
MKSNQTIFKTLSLFVAATLLCTIAAASVIEVAVENNAFTPADITINQGDTVVWNFINGSHNVNGEQAEFSGNPEDFISGSINEVASYTMVFTIVGVNDYVCDQHSAMEGTVTVESTLGVTNNARHSRSISAAGDRITVSGAEGSTISIYSITGRRVHHGKANSQIHVATVNQKGMYIVRVSNREGIITKKVYLR